MKIKIYYEDTDANNMVYHTAYLRFCERARSDIFFQQGSSPLGKESYFVVKNINANFKKSVSLGDQVEVQTSLQNIKKTSATLYQKILNKNEIIFDMSVVIVYLKNGKIDKMPEETISILKSI